MLPMSSGAVWMGGDEDDAASWITTSSQHHSHNEAEPKTDQQSAAQLGGGAPCFSNFKSMLEVEAGDSWYINNVLNPAHHQYNQHQVLQPMDSSSSCSPSQAFPLDSHQPPQPQPQHLLLPPKSCFSSLLSAANPFDNGFDLGCETSFLGSFQPNQQPSNPSLLMGFTRADFPATSLDGFQGFDGSAGAQQLLNRAKLQVSPSVGGGGQPTLFQKRAALRQNSGDKLGDLEILGPRYGELVGNLKRKRYGEGQMEEGSLNDDSDEFNDEYSQMEENVNNAGDSAITGGGDSENRKGKRKGLPAKNLMAERRRRKKLNDRLYMLRSVVPKISKMDRASILGDAIDYLKELLQRINDLHTELESAPPGTLLPPSTSLHPLTPTPPTLPCRVKEELCQSTLPSPKSQPPKVEVRIRDGQTVNIHMFCSRRPGLLLSTMRAMDTLGLDIQQAVISCFNGFALDVFRAEQCRDSHYLPEQIKAVLLDSAGCPDDMM